MIRHGPHQGAHASTSTGTGERSTSAENVASVTVTGWSWGCSGALHRPHTGRRPAPSFARGIRLVVPHPAHRMSSASDVMG